MADDYAGSTATTGSVSVGGSQAGNIESAGDTDWFRVTLVAGQTYRFDVQGSPTGQGTLADTYMRLRDSSGNSLVADDDSGSGLNSEITYTATAGGTYYISAGSATTSGTGTYHVSATLLDMPPPSDGPVLLSRYPISGELRISQGNRDNDDTHDPDSWLQWAYDFKAVSGSDVHAVEGGTVVGVWEGWVAGQGYGNVVTVLHDSGFYATYAHLSDALVSVNNRVEAGWVIAISGSTGTGAAHLHIQFGSDAYFSSQAGGVLVADGRADVESPAYFPELIIAFVEGDPTDTNYVGTRGIDDFTGNSAANSVVGLQGDDVLRGRGGGDNLDGGAGNDTLDGGTGSDILKGGAGNDNYVVDNVGDIADESIAGSGGTDAIYSSAMSVNLADTAHYRGTIENAVLQGAANLNLTGNGLANILVGNTGNNTLDGGAGADFMRGGAGNDNYIVDNAGDIVDERVAGSAGADGVFSSVISINLADSGHFRGNLESIGLSGSANLNGFGNSLNNFILGNSGANVLDGRFGADFMRGGAGNDVFRFDTALGGGNIDSIADYATVNDQIQIDNAVFTGLANGSLTAAAFFTGTAAHDADDRIIYNSASGALFFDADGTGATAQIQFATLSAGLAMAAGEFTVI